MPPGKYPGRESQQGSRKKSFDSRRKLRIIERRRIVIARAIRNVPFYKIAEECGVAPSTITSDIKALTDEAVKELSGDFRALIVREIQKLDEVEREAWEAWQRSKSGDLEQRTESEPNGDGKSRKVTKRVVARRRSVGTARFLEIVNECIQKRIKLLGLDRDEEQASDYDPDVKIVEVVIEDREQVSQIMEWSQFQDVTANKVVDGNVVETPTGED